MQRNFLQIYASYRSLVDSFYLVFMTSQLKFLVCSAGLKRHSHFCHDIFLIHVRCRILSPETFSSSLWYGLFQMLNSITTNTSWEICSLKLKNANLWLFFAALYFVAVATIAAFTGQHVVRRIIAILGRASLIIFILAFTIFVSAISLGMYLTLDATNCLACDSNSVLILRLLG